MKSKYVFALIVLLAIVALVVAYVYITGRRGGEPTGWLFTVDVNGERFKVLVKDPEIAEVLRSMMRGEREGIIMGEIRKGDGGFNKPWSWHLDPDTVKIVDLTIELCDGTPSFVESDLDYWVNVVKRYCPWGGEVVAEEPWFESP
uniref:BP74 N-terminal domain-containing protein n=1 Tax=Thermosphaera aggregans TaxID=54254 RepID=A0A7C2BLC1_9CREN